MTENKRFRIYQDLYEDFYIEDIESYNNQKLQRSYKVGNEEDVKYENVENIVDLLNEQEKRINNLKETIIKITHSYHQKHDNTIVNLVDEVYEENIGDLFIELNHSGVK